jgi:hypothetical protein
LLIIKPLCKTLEQPKASSLACPHVSHMSFKQDLKLPSRHPSVVGSIKDKLVVTFLCFFNLKCHCFVFVFFVASVVATPQSLSSSFFVFFRKEIMLHEWHQVSSLLSCVLFLFFL